MSGDEWNYRVQASPMIRFGEIFVLAKNDRFDSLSTVIRKMLSSTLRNEGSSNRDFAHVFAKDRVGTVRHAEICL